MNILVIGNGFDLAHGLPTRYTDFLKFTELFVNCYEKVQNRQIDWSYFDTRDEVNAFLKSGLVLAMKMDRAKRKLRLK